MGMTKGPEPFVSIVLVLLGAFLFSIFLAVGLELSWPEMQQHTWLGMAILAAAAIAVSGAAYYVREYRRHWLYPLAEISAGIAIAIARPETKPIVALIGFVAAVRIIIDGAKRFVEFRGLQTKKAVG